MTALFHHGINWYPNSCQEHRPATQQQACTMQVTVIIWPIPLRPDQSFPAIYPALSRRAMTSAVKKGMISSKRIAFPQDLRRHRQWRRLSRPSQTTRHRLERLTPSSRLRRLERSERAWWTGMRKNEQWKSCDRCWVCGGKCTKVSHRWKVRRSKLIDTFAKVYRF